MSRKLILPLAIALWSVMSLLPRASAETTLNRATLQSIRNIVRLIPQNRSPHPARVSEAMSPGDALSTGQLSLAELRFNDGSLARIGEQALFRFVANTRNFSLNNGTVLLLIPPGQGRTNLRTPNAAAAIRGSALFARYNPDTDTTVIGALTNSNIEVSNQSGLQSQVLRAGQLAVIVQNRIERVYEFDLKTFYQTSNLVRGLELNQPSGAHSDAAIALVRAETAAAAAAQSPITGKEVVENPDFVKLHSTSAFSGVGVNSQPAFPLEQPLNEGQILYNLLTQPQPTKPSPVVTPTLPVGAPVPTAATPTVNNPGTVGNSLTSPVVNIPSVGNTPAGPVVNPPATVSNTPVIPGVNVSGSTGNTPVIPGVNVSGSTGNTPVIPGVNVSGSTGNTLAGVSVNTPPTPNQNRGR